MASSEIASFLHRNVHRCWGSDLNYNDCVGDEEMLKFFDPIVKERYGVTAIEELFFIRDTSTFNDLDSGTAITEKGFYIFSNSLFSGKSSYLYLWEAFCKVEFKGTNFIFYTYPNEQGEQEYFAIPQKNFVKASTPQTALINNLLKLFNKILELAAPVKEDDAANAIIEVINELEDDPQAIIDIASEALDVYPSISDYLKFEIGLNHYRLGDYQQCKRYLLEADNGNISNYYQTWLNILLGYVLEESDFKSSRQRRLVASKGSKDLVLCDDEDREFPAPQLALKDLNEADAKYFSSLNRHQYADHKLIYAVKDMSQLSTLSHNQIMAVSLQTLRDANLDFPMGHPVANQLYVCHPYCQNKFIPYDNYELEFIEDRIREFCEIAQCLGASSIKIEAINEESKNDKSSIDGSFGIKGGNRAGSGNASAHGKFMENIVDQLRNSMEFEQSFSIPVSPHIPESTVWLAKEPSWQRLIQQRMQGNLSRHREVISTSKSRLIDGNALLELNGEIKSVYADMGLNFSVELSNRLQTTQNASLSIAVEFFPLHQPNADDAPARVEQDSKETNTSFFKRLFK